MESQRLVWDVGILRCLHGATNEGQFHRSLEGPFGLPLTPSLFQTDTKERDIASWFIEDAKGNEDNNEHMRWLSGDTATVVVAGRSEPYCPTPTPRHSFG